MGALGEDIIGASSLPPFFKLSDSQAVDAPKNRKGDALRTYVSSFSGFQKQALVRSAKTGDTWRLVSDEGPYLNGHDAACCPLAFLSVGMVASFMNEILAYASQQSVEIRKLKLTQDNYYTMKGSMPRRTMVGGAENIELQVEIDCDLDDEQLNKFLTEATFASPLNGLMRGQLNSLFKLAKNGTEVACGKATELDGALLPDPGNLFTALDAQPSDLVLMEKVGPTPKKEVKGGTSTGSSSLSDEQDRFGRFVSMLKLDLPDYRIVQDTHFSLGGASGNTGKPGEADPIETHVYLQRFDKFLRISCS